MPTFKLTIEYEGTRYSGWQSQSNTPKTVQGNLLRAARQVFGDADVGGAGRTDSGVHASGQVAHLRIRGKAQPIEAMRKLNDLLPHDIQIIAASAANDRFHARHDATSRVYIYQISRRRTGLAKNYVWWIKDTLDAAKMRDAARLFEGMHDFSNFTDRRQQNESTKVKVDSVDVLEEGSLILVRIAASHFLWKMVRKCVAALVEVGRGTMTADDIEELIEGEGEPFQPTAPPSGLFLHRIHYGDEVDEPLRAVIPVPAPHNEHEWRKAKKN